LVHSGPNLNKGNWERSADQMGSRPSFPIETARWRIVRGCWPGLMSALGPQQTSPFALHRSALIQRTSALAQRLVSENAMEPSMQLRGCWRCDA